MSLDIQIPAVNDLSPSPTNLKKLDFPIPSWMEAMNSCLSNPCTVKWPHNIHPNRLDPLRLPLQLIPFSNFDWQKNPNTHASMRCSLPDAVHSRTETVESKRSWRKRKRAVFFAGKIKSTYFFRPISCSSVWTLSSFPCQFSRVGMRVTTSMPMGLNVCVLPLILTDLHLSCQLSNPWEQEFFIYSFWNQLSCSSRLQVQQPSTSSTIYLNRRPYPKWASLNTRYASWGIFFCGWLLNRTGSALARRILIGLTISHWGRLGWSWAGSD